MNLGRFFRKSRQISASSREFGGASAVSVVDFVSREVAAKIAPGISTGELERYVEEITRPTAARLYFKGYRGYPSVITLSVNDEILGAPPSRRRLQEGDLLKMEFGAAVSGLHAVCEWTFPAGMISTEDKSLLTSTYDALEAGVAQVRTGTRLGAISCAMQKVLTAGGLSANRQFVGYGIGEQAHMDPQIPCYSDRPDDPQRGPRLAAGKVLAIIAIAHRGGPDCFVDPGGWTIKTRDGKKAALFSRMVEVTDEGPKILTTEPVFDRSLIARPA